MKHAPLPRRNTNQDDSGFVLIVVLLIVFIACGLAAMFLSLTANDARITRMAVDQQKAAVAAEAGLEYGVMKLRDIVLWYQLNPLIPAATLDPLLNAIPPPAGIAEYAYRTPGGQPAFRVRASSALMTGTITNGAVARGSDGSYQFFEVTCGAVNTNSGATAVLKQTVMALGVYLIRYGVLYDGDLEILPGPAMEFYGRVHSNRDIYVGGPLSFYKQVTTHGNIYHHRKDDASRPGDARIADSSGNLVSMINAGEYIDSSHSNWMSQALTRWDGRVLSAVHGVESLDPPIDRTDDPNDLIERATPTNSPDYHLSTELEKFVNKAAIQIHVASNGTVTVTDYLDHDRSDAFSNAVLSVSGTTGGKPLYAKDADGNYLMVSNGIYDVTQTNFRDQHENVTLAPVDIYVDQLLSAFPDVADGTYSLHEGRGVVHVTRDDPDGEGVGVRPVVRLRNGRSIPAVQGLSIVSDLPVYVEGDYNTVSPKPAMVAGDAVTFLSKNWQDARSASASCNSRVASDTTYNTVIMTGNTETQVGAYNGGLENVLRFLENWTGKTVRYRGSIICLWGSELANAPWEYGNYYTAPTRNWGYDTMYLTASPPGMTRALGIEEIEWSRTTWQAEGW